MFCSTADDRRVTPRRFHHPTDPSLTLAPPAPESAALERGHLGSPPVIVSEQSSQILCRSCRPYWLSTGFPGISMISPVHPPARVEQPLLPRCLRPRHCVLNALIRTHGVCRPTGRCNCTEWPIGQPNIFWLLHFTAWLVAFGSGNQSLHVND